MSHSNLLVCWVSYVHEPYCTSQSDIESAIIAQDTMRRWVADLFRLFPFRSPYSACVPFCAAPRCGVGGKCGGRRHISDLEVGSWLAVAGLYLELSLLFDVWG